MKRLLPFLFMAAITWLGYHFFSTQVTTKTDALLLGFIAVVCFECVAVMFAYTRKWRILALGLLAFFLATGFLYFRVSAGGLGHNLMTGRGWIELIRALYLDAAILVAIGLNRWAWRHRREAFPWRRNAPNRPIFFPPEQDELP